MDPYELGRRGKSLAATYLRRRGWSILARNFRAGHREIDIVASRGSVLAFVEVKTRSGTGFGHPLEAVTRKKRKELTAAAREWLSRNPGGGRRLRFDAVAVTVDQRGRTRLEHVPDAWRAGP